MAGTVIIMSSTLQASCASVVILFSFTNPVFPEEVIPLIRFLALTNRSNILLKFWYLKDIDVASTEPHPPQ